MQAAAGLIGIVVKLTARMQRGKYQPFRADTLLMHSHRDTPSIVRNRGGTVRFQRYPDCGTIPRQMFIHRIVYNFIDQMVQPFGGYTSNIHAGSYPDSLQPLQYGDAGSIICICLSHISSIPRQTAASIVSVFLPSLENITHKSYHTFSAFAKYKYYIKWSTKFAGQAPFHPGLKGVRFCVLWFHTGIPGPAYPPILQSLSPLKEAPHWRPDLDGF